MGLLRRLTSSIVAQVTVLTLSALALLLTAVVVAIQTPAGHWVFQRTVAENAESVAELVWLIENAPEEVEPFILSAYRGGGRAAAMSDDLEPQLRERPDLRAELMRAPSDAVDRLFGREIGFRTLNALTLRQLGNRSDDLTLTAASALHVAVRLEDGRVLNVLLAPTTFLAGRPTAFLAGAVVLVFALALSFAVASVTLRPIRALEREAEHADRVDALNAPPLTGPAELQRVAAALNRMRARLGLLIREREQMVAAIAHDVRTGLTRLRLRMDQKGSVTTDDLDADLAHIETLVTDMLAYARAESPDGPRELLSLSAFAAETGERAPFDLTTSVAPEGEGFVIAGDPVALRRLVDNLLENARRYGGGAITLRAGPVGEDYEIRVEDDGPGLPDDKLEAVFEPFARGETSRNRETGGSGLGLGIARAIARAHGAALTLENREVGGLAAVIRFPSAIRA